MTRAKSSSWRKTKTASERLENYGSVRFTDLTESKLWTETDLVKLQYREFYFIFPVKLTQTFFVGYLITCYQKLKQLLRKVFDVVSDFLVWNMVLIIRIVNVFDWFHPFYCRRLDEDYKIKPCIKNYQDY